MAATDPEGFQGVCFRISVAEAALVDALVEEVPDWADGVLSSLGEYGLAMPVEDRRRYRATAAAKEWAQKWIPGREVKK
jgi:hypothetical protein